MTNNINIPDGFAFRFHPFCRRCPTYKPKVTRYMCKGKVYLSLIKCENYDVCKDIGKHVKEEMRNSNGCSR